VDGVLDRPHVPANAFEAVSGHEEWGEQRDVDRENDDQQADDPLRIAREPPTGRTASGI